MPDVAPMHVLVPLGDRVVVTGEAEHLGSEDVLRQDPAPASSG
jgi:hypothetical protein